MKCFSQFLIINLFLFCSSFPLICTKEEAIIACFKAIEKNESDTVKKIINDGLDVNSILDLNNYFKTSMVKGESKCSLLEWARYKNNGIIYKFLSEHKEINFKAAGFLPFKTGSLLSLNKAGYLNENNEKNQFPIRLKDWPVLIPIQITSENIKTLMSSSKN